MKRFRIPVALAAATVGLATLGGCSGDAGTAKPVAVSETPATANPYTELSALPDWSGVWEPARFAGKPAGPPPGPPKLTPEYAAQFEKFQEINKKTPGINFVTQVANCVPPGVPASMQQPYPMEFLYTPGRVTIIIETYSMVRRIYTDGSEPKEPDPSYQGTSVGHWEGDTLVVETKAILPETSPVNGILGHSDQFKVTEKIRLVEPDMMEITTTREDPTVFTEPYTTTARYARHRDWHIMEYVCAQNNHDSVDEKGNPGFSLDRKPGE